MALPLSRPSLRRQDFDQVLDAMVHDRLASGDVTRQLGREVAKSLSLKQVVLLASVTDGVRRLVSGLGLVAGDAVVVSALAPAYWTETLGQLGLRVLFADVLADSPVLDPTSVASWLSERPKAVVADACLGYLPEVAPLKALGLVVIEDLSQGLGGRQSGVSVGIGGDAVLIRFAPETLVAGAGGCAIGLRLPRPEAEADVPSYEELTDLGSALILSQWKDAETFADRKRDHFRHLFLRLPKGYHQPKQAGDGEPVLPWFPILVESGAKEVLAHCRKRAVEADWAFRHQPYLNAETASDFCPRARGFLFHTLVLPLYSTMTVKELESLGKVISSLP